MSIVGSLLKETTRLGYKTKSKKNSNSANQEKVLFELLQQAKGTTFGKHFNFQTILALPDIESHFKEHVPIYNYESFYRNWIYPTWKGEKNVISKGRTSYFALTSGTSASSSKYIPVSQAMIRQFQKTNLEQIYDLYQLDLPASFFTTSVLTLGGSTKLKSVNQHLEGDLSGILQRNKSFVFKAFTKPGFKTAQQSDWKLKIQEIVTKAPKWDIGVIAGVPSWINLLFRELITTYQLNHIHELWPNLRICVHGGVFIEPYKQQILSMCGTPIYFQNTYLASEGYFAYQKIGSEKGMSLLCDHGIYYEFIEEKFFPYLQSKWMIEKLPTLKLSEVKTNTPYAIVITTNAGLYRYIIGDVIRFTSIDEPVIELTGRINYYLNMVGEHLSYDNMREALSVAANRMNVEVLEFCVVPSKNNDRHYWYLGSNQLIDNQLFSVYLNEALESLNDDYAVCRRNLLRTPKVKALPVQKFYDFMERKNKLGAQNKFPCVLQKDIAQEWENFLSCLDW